MYQAKRNKASWGAIKGRFEPFKYENNNFFICLKCIAIYNNCPVPPCLQVQYIEVICNIMIEVSVTIIKPLACLSNTMMTR